MLQIRELMLFYTQSFLRESTFPRCRLCSTLVTCETTLISWTANVAMDLFAVLIHANPGFSDRQPTPIGNLLSLALYGGQITSVHEVTSRDCVRFIDVPEGVQTDIGGSFVVSNHPLPIDLCSHVCVCAE